MNDRHVGLAQGGMSILHHCGYVSRKKSHSENSREAGRTVVKECHDQC